MATVQLPAAKVVFKDYQGNTILGQIKNRFKVPLKFKVLIDNRVLLCTFKRSAREHSGCCKTAGKLWQHITETLYGVFLVFLGSFDCQKWAIFHFGTLWA